MAMRAVCHLMPAPSRRKTADGASTAHSQEIDLDVMVTPATDSALWDLTDLLGRSMGHVAEVTAGQFRISPEGKAVETMAGINQGPYASLDDALAAIETHTRGVCRRRGI
jgi:hypothetical protein